MYRQRPKPELAKRNYLLWVAQYFGKYYNIDYPWPCILVLATWLQGCCHPSTASALFPFPTGQQHFKPSHPSATSAANLITGDRNFINRFLILAWKILYYSVFLFVFLKSSLLFCLFLVCVPNFPLLSCQSYTTAFWHSRGSGMVRDWKGTD